MGAAPTAVEVFCCYAHEDEAWRQKLEAHLNVLKRQGLISLWHDRLIVPGTDWAEAIDTHLETSSIVLLLVSVDFFLSDYCYGIEMRRAMERQETGEALVIPILVRPVDWNSAPFAHLQVLPSNAKPLSTWQDEETALTDVTAGIRSVIEDVSRLSASAPRVMLPAVWNIPYPRNPFFLGRDVELELIHQFLQTGHTMALSQPQAISGLGGIGKTQLALEYAYRYYSDYRVVLWVHAESIETLISSYIVIAALLNLPEREAKEQDLTVQAVKSWLQTHRNWLLILDNADELELLSGFLPPSPGGHLILTTRASATRKLAHRLEIETLLPAQATLFLLRRAGLITRDAELRQTTSQERTLALQISEELGRLPLALDQAAAYIEETRIDLTGYWHIYRQHRADLLQQRRGLQNDHPAPVVTTWSLAFQRVEEKNPAAAELLRLFAYLAPDAIPEELLTDGATALGGILAPVAADAFLLNHAIEALHAYSLIRRDPKGKTLSVHRLVQAVLQDAMEQAKKRLWVERALHAVIVAFPRVEYSTRSQCERLLPHALMITQFIEQYQIISKEAGRLLYITADYLQDRGRYVEAEPLLLRALHIWEPQLGPEDPSVLDALYSRAGLYKHQGKYNEAEALYKLTLHLREQQSGPEHPNMIYPLHSLASLYREQGKFSEAEPLFLRAQHIGEQQLGPEHVSVADSLNSLATLYRQHGKYAEAEPLYQRALSIREQQLGPEHPEVAYTLNSLAALSRRRGEYAQSEALYKRALAIWEQQSGVEHPHMAHLLNGLAVLYQEQGKYVEAEALYKRALGIREPQLGLEHPYVAYSLHGLASLYHCQRKYTKAEVLYKDALQIWEKALLLGHPAVAEIMYDLARLQEEQDNNDEARDWYTRALAISEQAFGVHHPKTTETRRRLITKLHANQGQKSQVQRFFEDAGFKCTGIDEPGGFLGIPEAPLWQKKFKHSVYMYILTGKRLDGNDILLMHGAVQKLSKDITLAFAIVDKPVDDHAWLQIAALRAYNFSVIPIPFTLLTENQTLDKVINASALLDKHVERFLGQGADPYNVRHPIFDVLNFFGREALARDLIERMNSGRSIGLFGLRKIGKSSLMQYMRGLMPCPTAYLDLQAGIEPISLYKRILRSWDNDARVRFKTDLNLSNANLSTEDPTTEFVKITQATLDKIADRKQEAHLAIFLDEIELIIPPLDANGTTLEHYLSLTRMLRGLVQEDGRILLMVAGVDPAINHMSRWGDEQKQNPFFMLLEELYLPPLFESDCIQMVRNIGTQVQLSYSEEATAYVAQMSGGHPYLARQLCSLAYKQRHQRMGELTLPAMQQAVERFLFDPKYASSINASGLWGEVTNIKLWGEQTARANQDILFMLAQSTVPLAESVITNGSDPVALRSALFSLQELSVIRPIEHPSGSNELCYAISFGLFHSWIRRVRLGLEGES